MLFPSRPKAAGYISVPLLIIVVLGQFSFDSAHAQGSDHVTVQEFREALQERDAIIIELLNRIRALEQSGTATASAQAAIAENGPLDDGSPAIRASRDAGADDLEVDALVAERALERGLVQEGTRLLAPGQIEFAPAYFKTSDEGMFPIALMEDDGNVVGEVEQTIEISQRRADLRFGLRRELQLEVGLPYRTVDRKLETGINGAVQATGSQSGSGFGDISIGLAKVLTTERRWRPNMVGRLVWLTGSGSERDDMVFLGGGTGGARAQLAAYWRRDPVVFLMSGGYTHVEDGGTLRPGDSYDMSVGLGLAVSPETALLFSLDQISSDEFRRDRMELPGTDQLSTMLGISASTILGRRHLLRVNADVGLTGDAPDYRFGISLSSRFNATRASD